MTTPADPRRTLTRLRELAAAATPGPWRCAGTPSKRWPVVSSHDRERGYQLHSMAHVRDTDPDMWKHMKAAYCADAEYIAAVDPQTVLSILDQLQRATDALDAAEAKDWTRVAAFHGKDVKPTGPYLLLSDLQALVKAPR